MKRMMFSSSLSLMLFLSGCSQSMEYSVLEEKEIQEIPEVSNYVTELQSNTYKGYKLFHLSDKDHRVRMASGKQNKTLKLGETSKSSLDTSITVVETEWNSGQSNSYIAVRIDEIVGAFYVFERIRYEGDWL